MVCIPRLSSILLAAQNKYEFFSTTIKYIVIDVEQKDCGSNLNARNPVGLNSNKIFHKGTKALYCEQNFLNWEQNFKIGHKTGNNGNAVTLSSIKNSTPASFPC